MQNNKKEKFNKRQKLNTLVKEKKLKLTICLDRDKDNKLCDYAQSNKIFNNFGMPNRSGAIESLIDQIDGRKEK